MKRSEILFGILRIPLDTLACLGALLIAYKLRVLNIDLIPNVQLLTTESKLPLLSYYLTHFAVPAVLVYIVVSASLQLYSLRITLGPWREMGRVILASLLWVALIMAWFFLVQRQLFFSRLLLVHATFLLTLFVLLLRTLTLLLQRQFLRRGIGKRTVLSCGSSPLPVTDRKSVV